MYPLNFQQNNTCKIYSFAGVLLLSNVACQVFKPWLCTSLNPVTYNTLNLFKVGETIMRILLKGYTNPFDMPTDGSARYLILDNDPNNIKWWLVSFLNWPDPVAANAYAFYFCSRA